MEIYPAMKRYVGMKIIRACLMGKREAQAHTTNKVMTDSNERGYLVEYKDGYVSWSPTAAFEDAYKEID